MTQPAGRAAYCQSKARYCWNIFQKFSPYNLMGRGVRTVILQGRASKLSGAALPVAIILYFDE